MSLTKTTKHISQINEIMEYRQTPGGQVFTFTVLEELTQKAGQSADTFRSFMKTLEEMWRATLDPTNAYEQTIRHKEGKEMIIPS